MKVQQCLLHGNLRAQVHWLPTVSPIRVRAPAPKRCGNVRLRHYTSPAPRGYRPLETLEDANINSFREEYFTPERPIILPRRYFRNIPAFQRWFQSSPSLAVAQLNTAYLAQHGADASVPLELTQVDESAQKFRKFYGPLSLFLDWIRAAELQPQSTRLYLAQCQLLDLPQVLRDDFPTPELVAQAGKGDVYDTNVWIGYPPTYTPLHRDPNPNLFVQLAGRKVVRLLTPNDGQIVFSAVRGHIGRSGGREAAAFRGEEMMQGQERGLLEQAVWDETAGQRYQGYEAELEAGDGLFIPKGWWHSIKGTGEGVTASPHTTYDAHVSRHANPNNNHPPPPPPLPASARIHNIKYTSACACALAVPITNPILLLNINSPPAVPCNKPIPTLIPIILEHNRNRKHILDNVATHPRTPNPQPRTKRRRQPKPTQEPPLLALPSAEEPANFKLDLSSGDSTVKLDHLGPLVVNQDGTLSRIGNWAQMTELEKKNTLRVLGKRNKARLEALKASQAGED
ncbi:hypothetical protein ARAM_005156 [Aspergillus rambellii]|uniref:JmjC domain-containing protein n=1 Tax=Aspergillus rambellii TaxID=308745 RepID=A0A0F8WJG1_9EURO|nr:hypothetical protein ARAM_005156 [Aspergillus rambellii]